MNWRQMRRIVIRLCLCAAAALLTATPARAQRTALTVSENLAELVDEAATIVRGHVMSARLEPHPQFPTMKTLVVTLRVEETLKGSAGSEFTFRQFLWDSRDAAAYRKGQHLLLLMIRPSALGLSSPAGLEQGRFAIRADAAGVLRAENGRGNAGLFSGLPAQLAARGARVPARVAQVAREESPGPLALDDLRALVRALAAGKP